MKVVISSSSDNSSSSSSASDSDDNEIFDPGHSKVFDKKKKVPGHIVNYIEKYATKGITKKNRQSMSDCWPIPSSKKLKGLETDKFYKKYLLKGKKWNAKLERGKINTQLRIPDVIGPLSLLWTEADRIKKEGQGMDPADVIQLAQRAIVLTGNAHYIFNYDRRKAVLAKTMSDNLDFLSEKKCQKALSKSNGQLFGKKFLKALAKENKELKEMLFSSINKKKYTCNGKYYNNRRNDHFFLQGPTNVLQSVGDRQVPPPPVPRRHWQGIQNRQNNRTGQHQNQSQGFKKPETCKSGMYSGHDRSCDCSKEISFTCPTQFKYRDISGREEGE